MVYRIFSITDGKYYNQKDIRKLRGHILKVILK